MFEGEFQQQIILLFAQTSQCRIRCTLNTSLVALLARRTMGAAASAPAALSGDPAAASRELHAILADERARTRLLALSARPEVLVPSSVTATGAAAAPEVAPLPDAWRALTRTALAADVRLATALAAAVPHACSESTFWAAYFAAVHEIAAAADAGPRAASEGGTAASAAARAAAEAPAAPDEPEELLISLDECFV
jgi:hypothetical protein